MEVTTGDGHQEIQSVEGTLRAHAGDGHIRATGAVSIALTSAPGMGEWKRLSFRVLSSRRVGSVV